MHRRRPNLVLLPRMLLCLALLPVAACGDDGAAYDAASGSYDGPLQVDEADARHPGAGAAGEVVECDAWGDGGHETGDVYREGATASSPDDALDVAGTEWIGPVLLDELEVAAKDDDRVLYVLDVEGVVKQAVVVRDGPASDGAGGSGWYVESWARCDDSELPRSYTESIGLQVWTDETGEPVSTKTVASWRGPEHCSWQSMTFLYLGKDRRPFLRDPLPDLRGLLAGPYQAHVAVPADARDTGYRREGRRLWVSADGRHAYVGSPDDAERWPRNTGERIGCA